MSSKQYKDGYKGLFIPKAEIVKSLKTECRALPPHDSAALGPSETWRQKGCWGVRCEDCVAKNSNGRVDEYLAHLSRVKNVESEIKAAENQIAMLDKMDDTSLVDMIYPMLYNDPIEFIGKSNSSWTYGDIYTVHSIDGEVINVRNNHGSLVNIFKGCFKKVHPVTTRPMTAQEIAMLPRGTAFVLSDKETTLYGSIVNDCEGFILLHYEPIDRFQGYRLPNETEIRKFEVEDDMS